MRSKPQRWLPRTCAVALAGMVVPGLALAASVPAGWFGSWKLDRAQSHLVGASITIGRLPHGYHFDFGAVSFDVGDDGKDYRTVPSRTTSLRAVGGSQWLRVHKIDGKEVDHSVIEVTPDQQTLLIHTVAQRPNGEAKVSEDRLQRVGAGLGLAGTWRGSVAGINVAKTIDLSDAGAGKVRWRFPDDQQYFVALPDGTATAYQGAHAVAGVTVRLRAISDADMRWTEFVQGKAYQQGIDHLSAHGSTLTETTWFVAKPQERQQAVYHRD